MRSAGFFPIRFTKRVHEVSRFRIVGAVLLGFILGSAEARDLRFSLVNRETIEARLREYAGSNSERLARLKRMFAGAGCGEHLSEQPVKSSKVPNLICVLPGTSDRVLIVGAHFDRVSTSAGVADNWRGASLLPSLYEALKVEPRQHTYEKGLVGSHSYVRNMTKEQIATTDAMINLDTLGLAPTEVWIYRANKKLAGALNLVATGLRLPLHPVDFQEVGSTDSESFRIRKIPSITIHSLTQKSEDQQILHSSRDNLSAMNLDYYYDTYHLVAVYLVYLDHFLDEPEPATDANIRPGS